MYLMILSSEFTTCYRILMFRLILLDSRLSREIVPLFGEMSVFLILHSPLANEFAVGAVGLLRDGPCDGCVGVYR